MPLSRYDLILETRGDSPEKIIGRPFARDKRHAFDFRRGNNAAARFNASRVRRVALTIAYDYTTPRDGPKTESRRPDKRS